MSRAKSIYLAITEARVHAWSSWSRWTEVRLRAERMGVRADWTSTNVSTKRSSESAASLERRLLAKWNTTALCWDAVAP